VRYGLTGDGIAAAPELDAPALGPADADAIRDVTDTEASRANPSTDVIGWANRRLAAIEEAAGDA
jgi:hypothetical protein